MEEHDKIVETAQKIFNSPSSAFRTNYEHQNALQVQLEKLEDSQQKLQPFEGGRSDEVRSNVADVRQKIINKLQLLSKNGTSPSRGKSPGKNQSATTTPTTTSGGGGAPGGLSLPGSEEWLRQLQAEDEVDQEHERRHNKHRGGKNRGGHHKPAGSKNVAHGGGAAAGEISNQRDSKNAIKQKLGNDRQSRLVNLLHPAGSTDNLMNLQQEESDDKKKRNQQQQSEQDRLRNSYHETHRDCHFLVITDKLLAAPATVTNIENQPNVEISFQPQKRLSVPTASLLLASSEQQNTSRSSTPRQAQYHHSTDPRSIASQVGFIHGGGGGAGRSGNSSRRSTPSKKKINNNSGKSLTPRNDNDNNNHLKSPNLFASSSEDASYVDCETKVQMYRSVFDVVWALQSAQNKGEIDLLNDETMMNAKSAEILASEIPVPIGGSGNAVSERRLGGVAKVEDFSSPITDDPNNNKREPSSQTPQFGSRAGTQEFNSQQQHHHLDNTLSPANAPDAASFPTLTTTDPAGNQNRQQQQQQSVGQYAGWNNNNNDDSDSSTTGSDDDGDSEYDDEYNSEDDDDDEDSSDDENDSKKNKQDDLQKLAAKLARENRERNGGNDDDTSGANIISTEDEDLFSKAKGIMTQTSELSIAASSLALLPKVTAAPWTIILVQGGYCAAAVFVQGIPIIHKAFHRYVVRKKQGGKQSNQEGNFGSAGSQIRKAQEKKFNEDVQILLDAWRNLIDASWFIFYSAPSPSNRKLLVSHSDKVVNAAFAEKANMHEAAQNAEQKIGDGNTNNNTNNSSSSSTCVFKRSDLNASPISYDDPRVKSVPMTTKRPVFGEVVRVYETLSRCTVRLYYRENKDDEKEDE